MSKEIQIRSLITLVLLVIAFQGDAVFSFLLEGLHLFVEVVELASEHLLETHFGLSTRNAQMITAWFGLVAFLSLSPFIIRKIMAVLGRIVAAAKAWLRKELVTVRQRTDKVRPRYWVIAGAILLATFSFFS
jgi:di/tricarboxylate transporter